MEDAAFSDEFCQFLRVAVPTVDCAELLFLLHRERERWWSPAEAAAALAPGVSVSEADAANYFSLFQSSAPARARAARRTCAYPRARLRRAASGTIEAADRVGAAAGGEVRRAVVGVIDGVKVELDACRQEGLSSA